MSFLLNEPEGSSFKDLEPHLGYVAAIGIAIDIELKNKQKVNGFIHYAQDELPYSLQLFKEEGKLFSIPTDEIVWFKLRRHGHMKTEPLPNGDRIVKMPVIVLEVGHMKGNGKIINPGGITAIHSETIELNEIEG